MELPTKQEKIEQIFFSVPKKHQQKYAETHKMLPDDHVPLVCFFEQCQNADRASGILDQLQQEKKEKALKKSTAKTSGLNDRDRRHQPRQCDGHRTRSHDCNDRHDCHRHYDRCNCND
jgi:hypothetical protein